jgi:hypothetical protein
LTGLGGETVLEVIGIARHPTADIAVLEIAPAHGGGFPPFQDFVTEYKLGEDLFAFGYPEDTFGSTLGKITPRLFRGYYQRYMYYHSPLGYVYNAGEMSIGAPAGLSGGPVFRPGEYSTNYRVTGIVTENLESTTFLDAVEEIQRDGTVERSKYQKIITYGVALLLDSHADWLAANGAK